MARLRAVRRRLLAGLAIVGLAALAGCGATISISIPNAAGVTAPAVPRGFSQLFSPAPHALAMTTTPGPVRRGVLAERYELRDGDCGGSDCGNFRARTEIVQDRDTTPARINRDFWAGWSFYNASIGPVTPQTALGTVIGQWRLEGEQPAIFRLVQVPPDPAGFAACAPSVCTRAGSDGDDVMVELDEIAETMGWGAAQNSGRICRLFNMAAVRGRWVDIVVNTNFGSDGYGYLRIWVDGQLRCNYLGQMVSTERARSNVPGPTHRRGIFTSYTRPWTEHQGDATKPTLVVFYDEYLEGTSRADVDTRLREASGLPPVN